MSIENGPGSSADEVFADKPEIEGTRIESLSAVERIAKGIESLDFPNAKKRAADLREAVANARAKNPGVDLFHIVCGTGADAIDLVFRAPSEPEFGECIGKVAEKKGRAPEALKRLAYQVTVWPDTSALRRVFERYAGMSARLAQDALAVAGGEDPDNAKKV